MRTEVESTRMDEPFKLAEPVFASIDLSHQKNYGQPIRKGRQELRNAEAKERWAKMQMFCERAELGVDLFTGEIPDNMIHPVDL